MAHGFASAQSWTEDRRSDNVVEYFDCFNVQVINLGEDYLIILPGSALFHGESPRMRQDAYPLMDALVEYLCEFTKISVRVEGFTDSMGSEVRNLALSKARAQNVADYLWSHDIDARLLYAEGHGGAKPMHNNDTEKGRAANERIEITFREIRDYHNGLNP